MTRTTTRILAGIAALALGSLTACTAAAPGENATPSTPTSSSPATVIQDTASGQEAASAIMADNLAYEAASIEYDEAGATAIDLSSPTTADGVRADGDTITIAAAGSYLLSGALEGQVVVAVEGEGLVQLVLDGASITSSTGAAISVTDAESVAVILADGSTNALTDAAAYADTTSENAANAALYSTADLTIGGAGALTVTGNANDGIGAKDGLVILDGTIAVSAVDDGIRGKDYAVLLGGTVSITAGGDGLKSDNEDDTTAGYAYLQGGQLDITAGDDGIDVFTDVVIDGATVIVSAVDDGVHGEQIAAMTAGALTVTQSEEGFEAQTVLIAGGAMDITATDDGINASEADVNPSTPSLTISDGTVVVDANGDGLDANGPLTITGGTTVVSGPTNDGNGAIDADGAISVTGGTLFAAGSSGMAMAPGEGSQTFVSASFDTQQAGSVVQVVKDDEVVASFASPKAFANVLFTSPDLTDGEYQIYVGGTPSGDDLGGFTSGGERGSAASVATVTANEAAGGMGPGGGFPGGGERGRPGDSGAPGDGGMGEPPARPSR